MLRSDWVGRRVAVRRAIWDELTEAVRLADVVGDLLELTADDALIDSAAGPERVLLTRIVAAREAHPSTADVLALEATAGQGWRAAEVLEHDGWLFRADNGFTGRANSVLPLRTTRELDAQLAAAHAWYAERGLPLRIQSALPARSLLDAELGERGWPAEPDVHVLAGRLDVLLRASVDREPGPTTAGLTEHDLTERDLTDVRIDPVPDEVWWAGYRYRGRPAPAPARALLVRHERAGFARIEHEGRAVAVVRGAVDAGWLGVFGLEVSPEFRRRGLARRLMLALWEWGESTHGASRTYLQVEQGNSAAISLYRGLGYWHHHDYRYRTRPS